MLETSEKMYRVLSVTAKSYQVPRAMVASLVILVMTGTLFGMVSSKLETSTSKIWSVQAINKTSG